MLKRFGALCLVASLLLSHSARFIPRSPKCRAHRGLGRVRFSGRVSSVRGWVERQDAKEEPRRGQCARRFVGSASADASPPIRETRPLKRTLHSPISPSLGGPTLASWRLGVQLTSRWAGTRPL